MIDAKQIKEKIVAFIKSNGPSLPVQVAKITGFDTLFTSAFLSELFNEKILKTSNLRIGSSHLYFVPEQKTDLERFSNHLKSKEKDAFIKLKESQFLKDSEQEPAIRVALREIKDFAIPFKKDEEVYWRYFTVSESNFNAPKEKIPEEKIITEVPDFKEDVKEQVKKTKKIKEKKKTSIKKKNKKQDENFFNKIKEFISKRGFELIDIEDFKNDKAVLKVNKNGNEELFFVFNKKKITEEDILKSNKIASERKLKYNLFIMGELTKKMNELIIAVKNLSEIGKLEE